jgi:hypothetical protein
MESEKKDGIGVFHVIISVELYTLYCILIVLLSCKACYLGPFLVPKGSYLCFFFHLSIFDQCNGECRLPSKLVAHCHVKHSKHTIWKVVGTLHNTIHYYSSLV